MVAYDRYNKLKVYTSPNQIILEHFEVRMEFNDRRKEWNLMKLNMELVMATEKMRFIRLQLEDKLILHKRKIKDIIEDLKRHDFKTQQYFDDIKNELQKTKRSKNLAINEEKSKENSDSEDEKTTKINKHDEIDSKEEVKFNYLLNMAIKSTSINY